MSADDPDDWLAAARALEAAAVAPGTPIMVAVLRVSRGHAPTKEWTGGTIRDSTPTHVYAECYPSDNNEPAIVCLARAELGTTWRYPREHNQ